MSQRADKEEETMSENEDTNEKIIEMTEAGEEAAPPPPLIYFSYKAGGLAFNAPSTPNSNLTNAFVRAKQSMGQRAFMGAKNLDETDAVAQAKAQDAAEKVVDPFEMEPCAMAVFMFLSREVEYRDLVIEQLNERLVELGVKPIDVEHPYPASPAEEPPETLPEGNGQTEEEKRLEGIVDQSAAAAHEDEGDSGDDSED